MKISREILASIFSIVAASTFLASLWMFKENNPRWCFSAYFSLFSILMAVYQRVSAMEKEE
jgi:hypothetical protein